MNAIDQSQVTIQPHTRKSRVKKVMQLCIILFTMTILLVARPQISFAGGSCSTTSGDCSGAITLYLS